MRMADERAEGPPAAVPEVTAEGGDPDPDLAALAAGFGGWESDRWKGQIRGRRRPVTAWSQWVLRGTPQEIRAEIPLRERSPQGG